MQDVTLLYDDDDDFFLFRRDYSIIHTARQNVMKKKRTITLTDKCTNLHRKMG